MPRNWPLRGRHDRTLRVGHRRGFRAVAGNDARHVRAVAVGVASRADRQTHGLLNPDASRQCPNRSPPPSRSCRSDPYNLSPLACRRHAHRRAAQVVGVNALAERLDDLHAGQCGQRHPILAAAARAPPDQTANCPAPTIRPPSFSICATVAAAPSLNKPSVKYVPAGSGDCFTAKSSNEGFAARLVFAARKKTFSVQPSRAWTRIFCNTARKESRPA